MKMSLGSFVIGLAIYLGFVWTRGLDQEAGRNDSRNIFIVLLVIVVACLYSYVGPALYKSLEVLPVQSWKDYQEKLKDFAETQARFLPQNNPQGPSRSDSDPKASAKKPRGGKGSSPSGKYGISSLTEPAAAGTASPDQFSSSGSLDSQMAQLITALRDTTSAQTTTNNSMFILMNEVRDLVKTIEGQSRGPRKLNEEP